MSEDQSTREQLQALDIAGPVGVTGASGYIASWIVKYLLDAGVEVRGSVRDKSRRDRVAHLEQLPGADERLRLFEADLLKPGSFDAHLAGCATVLHTASPFFVAGVEDPEAQLIAPARQGTRNVLEACTKAETVRAVVLTSSAAAVYGDNIDVEKTPSGVFDESMWNESSSPTVGPYSYSKTVAEREAWRLAEAQERWRLAVINPTFVLGPPLSSRADSTSVDLLRKMTNGLMRFGAPPIHYGVVDVRDVALAHLLAAAKPELSGRHLLAARTLSMVEIGQILRRVVGSKYPFPTRPLPKALLYVIGPTQGMDWAYLRNNLNIEIDFDTTRSREQLGLEYRPIEDTLRDAIAALEKAGLAG